MTDSARIQADRVLSEIRAGLAVAGHAPPLDDDPEAALRHLAPVDQFHVGGLDAIGRLIDATRFAATDHVADIGCGTGGPARTLAVRSGARVTGFDVSQTAVAVGIEMTVWTGLGDRVDLQDEDAIALPAVDGSFDGAMCVHVGMFVADKDRLYDEALRILRPGGRLAIYDPAIRTGMGHPYPVPWAADRAKNRALSAEAIADHLRSAGFVDIETTDRTDEARAFFAAHREARERAGAAGAISRPPPLGLHLIVGPRFPEMVANGAAATMQGAIGFAEIHARKPA